MPYSRLLFSTFSRNAVQNFKKNVFVFFFPTVFALVTTTLACWLPVPSFLVGSELLPSCGAGGRSLGSWRDGAG